MKKTYVKPQVYFESFQLSANIAAGCAPGYKVGYSAETCFWNDDVGKIFSNTEICEFGPDYVEGKICYHTPLGSETNVFAS